MPVTWLTTQVHLRNDEDNTLFIDCGPWKRLKDLALFLGKNPGPVSRWLAAAQENQEDREFRHGLDQLDAEVTRRSSGPGSIKEV